jgi:cytochrome c oxidase subunit 2
VSGKQYLAGNEDFIYHGTSMSRIKFFLTSLSAWFITLSAHAYTGSNFNMPVGVTPMSKDIYWLHMTIFWICVAIGVVVFGVMFYSLIMHRKSRGVKPATFHGNVRIEILWAVIPFLILVIMAIPATNVLIRMEDSSKADINIKITGHQWKWQYEYLDEGINFYSNISTPTEQIKNKAPKGEWYLLEVDKPLVVPIHKKIRFLVTANDVIHSWWVPELGIKRDAIPGFIHEAWARIEKPGIYRGVCAELCGINHAYMPIVVDARTQADYEKWVLDQKSAVKQQKGVTLKPKVNLNKHWTPQELLQRGREVYNDNCAVCHKPDGTGMPPAFPAVKGSRVVTGPFKEQVDIVLNGKNAMPAWGLQLNDDDIAAVITYERNSWGNEDKKIHGSLAGGVVMPTDVSAERKK